MPRRDDDSNSTASEPSPNAGTLVDAFTPLTAHEPSVDHDNVGAPAHSSHVLSQQPTFQHHEHHVPPPQPTQQLITIELLTQLLEKNRRDTVADTRTEISDVKKTFMAEINAVKMGQTSTASQETSVAPVQTILPQSNVAPSFVSSIDTSLPDSCL